MDLSIDHAQAILTSYGGHAVQVSSLARLDKRKFRSIKTYAINTESEGSREQYLIETFESPSPWKMDPATTKAILSTISERSSIPVPMVHLADETRSVVPFDYLLLSRPHNSAVVSTLEADQELQMGGYLKQLHGIDNDWFGVPGSPSDVISWQEAFTSMLDNLVQQVEKDEVWTEGLMEEMRRSLSRAIGFYLFDDVEFPSLVWFTGDEGSVMVNEGGRERDLAQCFGFSYAVWGDPLLETIFMSPSAALLEGYQGTPVVFHRQRTKRTWYTLFFGLLVMVESEDADKVGQARSLVKRCVDALRTAPCY